jgi:hypothetical protein
MGKELTSAAAKVLEIITAAYVLIDSHYIYSLLIFLECDIWSGLLILAGFASICNKSGF